MAAKKKFKKRKKAKLEKARRQTLAHLSREEARKLVIDFIDHGKPKEAIQSLQQTSFSDAPDFLFVKMQAYASRARQLQEKGLNQEAATILDILFKQLSQASDLDCEHLAQLIQMAPLSFGLKCYEQHQKKHSSCPWIQRALANQLVLSGDWESLHRLPDELPIKKDGLIMVEAIPHLEAGRWQEGVEKLTPLPRKSPFASWKWFAKAMVSVYQREEETLQRALAKISQDFPLRNTLQILEEQGCQGREVLHERVNRLGQSEAQELVKAIEKQDKYLSTHITQFAQELLPENPQFAIRCLSEMVACALMKKNLNPEFIQKVLPSNYAKPILIRLHMFSGPILDPHFSFFTAAFAYLQFLDLEFPQMKDKKKIEAAIYSILLSKAISSRINPYMLGAQDRSSLRQWLGNPSLSDGDLFVALAEKITRLAPDVAPYYKVLNLKEMGWVNLSSEGKKLLEQALLHMQEVFPEDPFSYLELAKLYWNKGAYRKSQKILGDGWNQAPYDPQVREQYGLGLLRAAIKARSRGAYHLVRKDLEAALSLNVAAHLPLIHDIEATLSLLEDETENPPLESLLNLPDVVLQYRTLIYFCLDLLQLTKPQAEDLALKVSETMLIKLGRELDQLSSAQLGEIVAPIPEDYADLLKARSISTLFGPLWSKILKKLDDQQALTVYAQVLGEEKDDELINELITLVEKDIKARLRKQKENIFLRFYATLVEYLLHPHTGVEEFLNLLDELDHEEKQELRRFCQRIAPHFKGALFMALNSFDFYALEKDDFWFPFMMDEEEEDEDWEDDDWIDGSPIEQLAEELERLRGNSKLLEAFFEMLVLSAIDEDIEDEVIRMMGHILETKAKKAVRTLRAIYSGKKRKKLSYVAKLLLFPDR
jgi:hypothetical protein